MSRTALPQGNWLLITGIGLVVLGVAAVSAPAIAGEAVVYLIGGVLTLTGLLQVWAGLREESGLRKISTATQGALVGIAGIAVLAHPFYGLAALSLVLAIYFLSVGLWRIVTSFAYRPATGWLALLLSGVIALVLAWMIWSQWPVSGMWAVGILVGVDLISTGLALIVLAITLRQTTRLLQEAVETVKDRLSQGDSAGTPRS
jgi:uncharacterized membrane protein HdeD (DUF308 family)